MKKQLPQIDLNDRAYVEERSGLVVASEPCPQDRRTGKINPHVSRFKLLGKHEQQVSVFHVKPIYYEHVTSTDEELVFRPMYEVCEHYGNRRVVFKYEKLLEVHPRYIEWLRKRMVLINGEVLITSLFGTSLQTFGYTHEIVHAAVAKPKIGMTVTTVYPDPSPETTTVDGMAAEQTDAVWATIRAAAGDTATDSAAAVSFAYHHYTGSQWGQINRGFSLFDTSSIPDTDNIDSAILSYYVTTKDTTNTDSVSVIDTNPASNTVLVAGDYDSLVTGTKQSDTDIALSSISTSAYNDWTLNATGRGNISKTGVSKFGARLTSDVDNSEPASPSSGWTGINVSQADQTGTTEDPKLAVTHSASTVTYRGMFALVEKA